MLFIVDSLFQWGLKSRGTRIAVIMEEETVRSLTPANFGVGELTAVLSQSSDW